MQFIKDLAKLFGVILGITLFLALIGWIMGAKSGKDKTEYYLYEHEVADEFNEQNNAPWADTINNY